MFSVMLAFLNHVRNLCIFDTALILLLLLQTKLHGVLPVDRAAFAPLQQHALHWSNKLKQSFAVCHNLNMAGKSLVAGADMERNLFKAVEAHFVVRA